MGAKTEIEEYARRLLADRLALLEPKQRDLFDRCFPKGVPSDRLESAIDLCERTLQENASKVTGHA